ncbi:hypothetical protein HK100_010108 [Physocladia obscura]|uniref:WSC domain-containing protein n=1 Tax=Physocladia obscura TaxID=109957 RepID=A0AAD5T4F5_9FUNG|nr:hypothetical protein HK100_010108 [Physocladia obscura]
MKRAVLVQLVVSLVSLSLFPGSSSECVALSKSVTVKQQSTTMNSAECVAVCANYTLALIAPTPADASYVSTTASVSAVPILFYCACVKKMSDTAVNSTGCTLTCPDSTSPDSLCGGFDYTHSLIAWSVYNVSAFTTIVGAQPLSSSSSALLSFESIDPNLYPTDTSASFVATSSVAVVSTTLSQTPQPLSTSDDQHVAVNVPESSTSTTSSSSASPPSWRALVIVCSLVVGAVFTVSLFAVLIHCRNQRTRKIISSEAADFDAYLNPSKQLFSESKLRPKIHGHATVAATAAINDDFVEDHSRPSVSMQRISPTTPTGHHYHHHPPQIFTRISDIAQHRRPQTQTPDLKDEPDVPHSVKIGPYIGAIREETSNKSISGRILSAISSSTSRIDTMRSKSVGSSSLSYRNDSLVGRGYQNSSAHASSLYMETIVQNDRIEFSGSSNEVHSEDD